MKKIYALLSTLIFIISCSGQNSVFGLKDKNENLWFTVADRGVYRYDGKSFVNFTKENYSLNVNFLSCLYEDKTGNLWFGADDGGVYTYDGKSFTRFLIPIPDSNIVGPEKYSILSQMPIQVEKVLQDKNENFWFLTIDHGVYRYDANLRDSLGHQKSFTSFLLNETPNCILESKKGDIFIGSWRGGGVYHYDEKSSSTGQEGFTRVNGFSDGMIACMLEDKIGNIWVGTRNSTVDRYDGKSFTNFSEKDGLTNNCIRCIYEDSRGNIWLGSDIVGKTKRGDAFRYNGKSFTNITAQAGLAVVEGFVYGVTSIVEDKAGNIWIGSKDGLLLCYDGKRFINFSEQLLK